MPEEKSRVEQVREQLKAAIDANNDLVEKTQEYLLRPDMIVSFSDILRGVGKTLKLIAPVAKMSPYSWLSWVLSLEGAFLEGIANRKEK